MAESGKCETVVTCPCCGARLTVDMELGKVIAHEPPPRHSKAPDLDEATRLLEKQKAQREALFAQSAEDEKVKSKVLERKFEEASSKPKTNPSHAPTAISIWTDRQIPA
jgi:hypothetical protein